MNVKERMKLVRLIDKMNENPAYSSKLGLKDKSVFSTVSRGQKPGGSLRA